LTELDDNEVGQLTDIAKKGGKLPLLLPSELAKVRAQLANESELAGEGGDFNPIADAFTQNAIKGTYGQDIGEEALLQTLRSPEDNKADPFDKRGVYGRDTDFEQSGAKLFKAL